jgi:S1-C subfamily serine protease
MKNLIIIVLSAFFLTACGSSDSKISKGHRDAINQQCKESSDIKACALEVRANFLAEGNEFITLDELNKDQKRKIRMECVLSKKFGLEAYNTCLEDYKIAALDGDLFKNVLPRIPKSNIEKLETLTVKIEIVESQDDEKIYLVGSGSGVILNKELVATNCHVALGSTEKPNRALIIKHINKESYAIATIYKKAVEHDVCILKKVQDSEFKFEMNSVKKLKKFEDLRKGQYVRSLGTPENLEGHTAKGEIQYLGTAGKSGRTNYGDYTISADTKIIEHSARIAPGSSGGPLFGRDNELIGLNTFGNDTFNFSVSADHIKELLKK